jgi:hypothetical protein
MPMSHNFSAPVRRNALRRAALAAAHSFAVGVNLSVGGARPSSLRPGVSGVAWMKERAGASLGGGAPCLAQRPRSCALWPSGACPSTPTSRRQRNWPDFLRNDRFVKSRLSCPLNRRGSLAMPARLQNGRNVESGIPRPTNNTADGHERAKDFLGERELVRLLDSSKASTARCARQSVATRMFRHGFRASEVVAFRCGEVDLDLARLWCGASSASCRSSNRSLAMNCAPSGVTSHAAWTRCLGCSSPNVASR